MKFDIDGDALKLLNHFIYYGTNVATATEVADALQYDYDGFKYRMNELSKQVKAAERKY